jgi:hypothetical protein
MKDQFKILTRRKKGESHRETEVTIDWSEVTESQLRTLARRALVYNFQCSIQKDPTGPFPEKITITAREEAQDHTPVMEIIFAPRARNCSNWTGKPDLEELMKMLTPEELLILLESEDG